MFQKEGFEFIHHKIGQGDGTEIHQLTKHKLTLSVLAARLCPRHRVRVPLEIGKLGPRTHSFPGKSGRSMVGRGVLRRVDR